MTYWYWQSKQDRQWYWHLKAGNGEIIAHGEGYRNEADCVAAIGLVKNSGSAPVKKKDAA